MSNLDAHEEGHGHGDEEEEEGEAGENKGAHARVLVI